MTEPDVERRAEEVSVRFLSASGAEATADPRALERLCAGHRDLEPALRGLFADWRRITGLMGQSLGPGPGPLPVEADPRVTLGDGGELESELLRRTRAPAPWSKRSSGTATPFPPRTRPRVCRARSSSWWGRDMGGRINPR